jgi:hypothetical protein
MAKTPAYVITTADDTKVAERTEGKAADKLALKLANETGLVHRVYTPTGKLRLTTEIFEFSPADEVDDVPADEVPTVDINEGDEVEPVAEDADETETDEPAAEVEVEAAPVEVAEVVEVVEEAAGEPEADEDETGEDAPRSELADASYAHVQGLLKAEDEATRTAAKAEWARRLDIYREASRDKDASKRIVGPAMAAALERGETTDGRTRAALIKRGLADAGDGLAFTVNAAGRAARDAAVAVLA